MSFLLSTNQIGREEFARQVRSLTNSNTPYLFLIDYHREKFFLYEEDTLPSDVTYNIDGYKNYNLSKAAKYNSAVSIKKYPVDFTLYNEVFKKIKDEIILGNGYLLNLTFPTPIELNIGLAEVFLRAKVKFKIYHPPFVCFSPERFVQIKDNTISTYPIKGTIVDDGKNAFKTILDDEKELAEHTMVTDLLRNDLSIFGKNTRVEKFRYIDRIQAGDKTLLQVTSKISSDLPTDWKDRADELLFSLLPAGSITGAPKKSVCQILQENEIYDRGFFTGICGYYRDGFLDSFVMIRFIEETDDGLVYKSGGGITYDSDSRKEYNELIDKVYVPIF